MRSKCQIAVAIAGVLLVPIVNGYSQQGLIPTGPRPSGALSGKIVFVHAGHGYTAASESDGAWSTQRPLLLNMVEDLGNKDQMDLFVDHLFRAGATLVPLRPVGHQPLEVVLDNEDPAVTFLGDWRSGRGGVGFGKAVSALYRIADTSPTETAVARYRPNLPVEGYYPVYTWVSHGPGRAGDQLYRIRHSGGATEITIDHSRVGHGLVFLGEHHFRSGRQGWVEVSNRSKEAGRVVVADMIRFGNGRGDIRRGGGASGQNREDEAALYWAMWHAERSQGVPEDLYRDTPIDRLATISLAPRVAALMNREAQGPPSDRVLVSFHSNGSDGASRGVLGLVNGNNYASSRTRRQTLLAETLASEVNIDLVAQSSAFEHHWFNRGDDVTLDRSDIEFGEINNKYLRNEFDATIVETGFHDNPQDAQLLRDPRVRDAIAQATCQGLIKYFHEVDPQSTPLVMPPEPVTRLEVSASSPGVATLAWGPAPDSVTGAGAAEGYVVYSSTNGYGFDSGRIAAGGHTTHFSVAGLDPERIYYFRVAAFNRGGESAPSEVAACRSAADCPRVLIVNGFDSLDRFQNPTQPWLGGGEAERVRPRVSNARNYAVPIAQAIATAAPEVGIETASNEAVSSGAVSLDERPIVFWMLGNQPARRHTLDANEQAALQAFLERGGRLLVSGSDVASDLDQFSNGRSFCRRMLGVRFVAETTSETSLQGTYDSAFKGLSLSFSSDDALQALSPDVIEAGSGATPALLYGAIDRVAAVQHEFGAARVITLAFPLESVDGAENRAELVRRVFRFFENQNSRLEASRVADADDQD